MVTSRRGNRRPAAELCWSPVAGVIVALALVTGSLRTIIDNSVLPATASLRLLA
jgi:hypothetical protein